ncbi:site-specific integrase [Xanthomonas campestris pv. incanae]|uniref:site-specific integrase n=1 Tax=Xanthomonas campestris TaxID=339 RepID=UPI002367C6AE|nr:site-specific integrase [Xanthomonas campestris]WDJ98489.1 site-specific integrase [Xanthomonas campestris pv. incanae]
MSFMTSLHAYAKWLEAENLEWWHFPAKEAERCLVRYRGALIDARDAGHLAPSTVQNRMAVVVRFYRWLSANQLISPVWPMWQDRQIGIRISDTFGFNRTLRMNSTNLAIPNRKPIGEGLEDGLLPVSAKDRSLILAFADKHASEELALMLRLGFRTGMRFGTIADLKVRTIERAVPDPSFPGWHRLSVGPSGHPPVHTKFGVSGQVWIEGSDLERLKTYAFSSRRLKRQSVASAPNRDCLFLTRYGGRYGSEGSDLSRSMNVELGRLRKDGAAQGIAAYRTFRFHQSRCTFATELARVAVVHGSVGIAIQLVKQALLHRNEASTLRYIQFVERTAAMAEAADAFTQSFLGLVTKPESI